MLPRSRVEAAEIQQRADLALAVADLAAQLQRLAEVRARRRQRSRLVLDLAEPRQRERAAAVVAQALARDQRGAVVLERFRGRAGQEVDAAEVVERRRDAGQVARQLEQLARQRQVPQRRGVLAEQAVQPPQAVVRRPALRRQVQPPGQAQELLEMADRLARAAEPRREIAGHVQGVELGDGIVLAEQLDRAQVQPVRVLQRQPRARAARPR